MTVLATVSTLILIRLWGRLLSNNQRQKEAVR
jgi:hypothetical protein